ncbi:MAG: hypothetical protein LUG49_07720 [Oscillospiraceae bacterium]|nr:hypothetical protein [Oscillospiraceae bacterium]
MYISHEMRISSFTYDEQFVCAITPGSIVDGDGDDNYSIKPNVSDI